MERLPVRRLLLSLCVAVTPLMATSILANASAVAGPTTAYAPLALGSQATWVMSSSYVNPPSGSVSLGGIRFSIGNGAVLHLGQQVSVNGLSYHKPLAVYMLVNSANSQVQYKGQTLGTVHVTFSNGTALNTALVLGTNIREWRLGAGSGYVTTATSSTTVNVWSGTATPAAGGGTAVIDMLAITIPATTANLTGVTVSNSAPSPALQVLVSGITVAYDPIVRPGMSWNTPAAWRSQSPNHANSEIFTGVDPAQDSNKHGQ